MLKELNLNAQCSTLNVQYSTGVRLLYNDRGLNMAPTP
jgi:hypothetical protein